MSATKGRYLPARYNQVPEDIEPVAWPMLDAPVRVALESCSGDC